MKLATINMEQPLPLPIQQSQVTAPFWQGLEKGEFKTRFCQDCQHISFPPKACCPQCSSKNSAWKTLSGKGILYSYSTVFMAPPIFGIKPKVAIVDLEEGVRVVTRLINSDNPVIDEPIQLVITQHTDGYLFAAEMI